MSAEMKAVEAQSNPPVETPKEASAQVVISKDELREMIRDVVEQVVEELFHVYLPDPDEGLELRPEIAEHLMKSREEKGPLHSLDEVMSELGLDE